MILVWLFLVQPPVKQEIETSIQKRDVPPAVLEFLESSLSKSNDIRYYRQTDGQTQTYEIKFRLDGRDWSVEFHPNGVLEDAEWLVNLDELSSDLKSNIDSHLNSIFTTWTATRVQLQYTTWPANFDAPSGIEIVVEGQNSTEVGTFEFFFPSDGSGISERRVLEILDF